MVGSDGCPLRVDRGHIFEYFSQMQIIMKAGAFLFIWLSLFNTSLSAEKLSFNESELSLGGVAIGMNENEVLRLHGAPIKRTNTGEGYLLAYSDFDVYVGMDGYGVFEVFSKNSAFCTPSKMCPGKPVSMLIQVYGNPVVVKREQGKFFEYYPVSGSCWLQVNASDKTIRSLRIACQP